MTIEVNDSASPLVHPLPSVQWVNQVKIKAQLKQPLDYEGSSAGARNSDDFPLRIGLVLEGNRRLNFFERMMAPKWVKALHSLDQSGSGIDCIHFLNFCDGRTPASFESRGHPLSPYLIETVVGAFQDGAIDQIITLEEPLPVIALWISCDGDDTSSKYTVTLEELELLQTAPVASSP
jgi:hypothetical protein